MRTERLVVAIEIKFVVRDPGAANAVVWEAQIGTTTNPSGVAVSSRRVLTSLLRSFRGVLEGWRSRP